jgi:hypothetical protein
LSLVPSEHLEAPSVPQEIGSYLNGIGIGIDPAHLPPIDHQVEAAQTELIQHGGEAAGGQMHIDGDAHHDPGFSGGDAPSHDAGTHEQHHADAPTPEPPADMTMHHT